MEKRNTKYELKKMKGQKRNIIGSNENNSIEMTKGYNPFDEDGGEKKDELDMVDYGLEFDEDLDETFGI